MLQNADDDLQQTWLVKDVEDIPLTNKMLLIKCQKFIAIILSSLLLTCFFGGFMICENKLLFKNAENQLFTCNVTKMEYGDFYNLLAQASSVKQFKRKQIELIVFDENHKTQYKGLCKIVINLSSKILLVKSRNGCEFKDISAALTCNFVKDNNILFVCAEKDFAIIFDHRKRCEQVYDRIKCNKTNGDNCSQLIMDHFLIPLFNDIRASNSSRIKNIVSGWIHNQNDGKRQAYVELLKRYNIFDVFYPSPNSTQRKQISDLQRLSYPQRKRKHSEGKNNCTSNDTTVITLDSDVDANDVIPKKKQKRLIEYKVEVKPENFKLIYFQRKRQWCRGLLVFTSSDKSFCYEYNWNYTEKVFFCRGCRLKCHQTCAIMINKNDGFESVKLENRTHICKPVSYDQEYYIEPKIIKKPKYEILEKCTRKSEKMLIIFHPDDKKKCYEYFNYQGSDRYRCNGCKIKKKHIIADICSENTENEYVVLLNENHICEIRKYDAKKYYKSQEFVLPPDFEIRSKIKDGIERKTLIIFDKNDRNLCYTYFYHNHGGYFLCNGCKQKQKSVMARMCKNAKNEIYIILANAEHTCSLRPYVPEKEIILLRSPDIEFMETTQKGTPKLFIFTSKNRKLCHSFSPVFGDNKMNKYYCLGCEQKKTNEKTLKSMDGRTLKGIVTVFLCKEDGEYYVQMVDGQKHICEAKIYKPEKYEVEILINPSEFILFREKGKKPGSMNLAIYHPDDRNLCYKYYYSSAMKFFRCFECEKKGISLAAKLQKNEDGIEYITVKQKKHLCSPIKVSSIKKPGTVILKESGLDPKLPASNRKKPDESKIVRFPNFELQKNKRGTPDGKLIIFTKDDKNKCYSYHFNNCSKYYFCSKCKTKNISVTAKLQNDDKNGERYLILGSREHLCQPMKYETKKDIIEAPNFMVLKESNKLKYLIIFTLAEKNLCYKYTYYENVKCFRCMFCNAKGRRVSAKLLKDKNNGEEYVQLQKNDHICSPQKYSVLN